MKKAMISLSFDDGRADNLEVFQNILFPLQLPVTLNVTTGYVDGSCPEALQPSSKPALTREDVQSLAQHPLIEIALHGDKHLNTEDDIRACRDKLISWFGLPKNHAFGFASPGSGYDVNAYIRNESSLMKNQIAYLRTSLRNTKYIRLRILCRKIGRIFHIPFLYRIAYADTLMNQCDDRVVYSIPILKDTTVAQVKAMVELCVCRRAALTLMFHSVTNDVEHEDNWSWSRGKLVQLSTYLSDKIKGGMLEVLTTQELVCRLCGQSVEV